MQNVCDFYRRPIVIMWLVMGMVLIGTLPACSRAPENPAWFQSASTGEFLDDNLLISRIGEVDDLFAIYRMKEEYFKRGGESAAINRALLKRMDALASQMAPLAGPCPEVDLVAFDYRHTGVNRYHVDFLFRVNKPIKTNLVMGLVGQVLEEDRDQLSPDRRKAGKKSESWTIKPIPPTPIWTPGEYVLVSGIINARPILYNMEIFFYDPLKKGGEQLYGNRVSLGWCRGLEEADLVNEIMQAENMIDLYRLAGDSRSSSKVAAAFEAKASKLLEANPPLGKICPEADLVAFDYSKIAENRYRVDYLFRVNSSLDKDCLIALYGVVDENHRDRLSEARRKQGKKGEAWSFHPNPPTRGWPAGGYVLISDVIEAQPIPYNMHTILYDREGRSGYGSPVSLGWRSDLGGSESKGE